MQRMSAESHLHRLNVAMTPKSGVAQRVRKQVFERIEAPKSLLALSAALSPSSTLRQRIWQSVSSTINSQVPETLWEKIREVLSPQSALHDHLRTRLLAALTPVQQQNPYGRMKWVAAAVVVAIVVQASPSLFIATQTVADSEVLLIPTRGHVTVSVGDLWQDVNEEIVLEPGTRVRTYDGEASILYHNDAVVRIDSETILVVHTTENGEEDIANVPEFSLVEGRIWLQGLRSPAAPGITVAVRNGSVTVNEASVSLQEQDVGVLVKVWDRNATLSYGDTQSTLTVGEQTQLHANTAPLIKKIPDSAFNESWAAQNLEKDAVHRRYISHLQHERRVAGAGILPTSSWYPVKRVAESMDVLFSISSESRVQKKLQQANARLNEASALITGGEDANAVLNDFRETLISLYTGTGGDLNERLLIQQSIEDTIADVAVSLPGEDSYVLKRTVLSLASNLPEGLITPEQVQTVLLVDSLASLDAVVKDGSADTVEAAWHELQPYLGLLNSSSAALDPQARKEAKLILTRLAREVENHKEIRSSINSEVFDDIVAYLPPRINPLDLILSDEEVVAVAQGILERIYTFKMPQSRENQLRLELKALATHNERGRLLRALYYALPDESNMSDIVRREITTLQWEKAAEQMLHKSAYTGATL